MQTDVFLKSTADQMHKLIFKVERLVGMADEETINKMPTPDAWSIGQILDHLNKGLDYYLPGMRSGMAGKPKGAAQAEVKHSWFGRMIVKGIGPGGHAPVLRQLLPGNGPYKKDIVSTWTRRHEEIIHLTEQARGIDLSAVNIRNPFFKFVQMNLADFFAILIAHAEGHIAQIEERMNIK